VELIQSFTLMLLLLFPRGRAWPKTPGSFLWNLSAGLAPELARFHGRVMNLLEEADPSTTYELLEDWERCLGLPDPCLGPETSTALRQQSLVSKLTWQGGQAVSKYIAVAASLGYTITIENCIPPIAGDACADDEVLDDTGRFVFYVHAPGVTTFYIEAGSAEAGDEIETWSNDPLECAIRKKCASHLRFFLYDSGDAITTETGDTIITEDNDLTLVT
jgi:uncharacterized protein YmfQ (DUF2313 family)